MEAMKMLKPRKSFALKNSAKMKNLKRLRAKLSGVFNESNYFERFTGKILKRLRVLKIRNFCITPSSIFTLFSWQLWRDKMHAT